MTADLSLLPNPAKAATVLEEGLSGSIREIGRDPASALAHAVDRMATALGLLRGYALPLDVAARYVCACGACGVKLWRESHTAGPGRCASCVLAHLGLSGTIDEDGRILSEITRTRTEQLYAPGRGSSWLPWMPSPNGLTWSFTSAPDEAVVWWRGLPTYPPGVR